MTYERPVEISDALQSLVPGAEWVIEENDITKITWLNSEYVQPSDEEILAEVDRLVSIREEAEAAKVIAKESALAKLAALGLTEEEARALVGGV